MAWTLRCRGPGGQATLTGLGPDSSVAQLQDLLYQHLGVAQERQELLSGFPPRVLQLPADRGGSPLSSLSLSNGDTLTVREGPAPAAAAQPTPSTSAAPAPAAAPATSTAGSQHPDAGSLAASTPPLGATAAPAPVYLDDDDDEGLAQALAASLADVGASSGGPGMGGTGRTAAAPPAAQVRQSPAHPAAQQAGGSNAPAPTSMALTDGSGSAVVRRVIDSDNSCLFNAVGYTMEHSRSVARTLRSVIARVVAADPDTYNEGFLGKTNEEYCKWIVMPDKWGGAIELSILSRHYAREIAAYDIQTKRVDVYGQDSGYGERVMVLYDGLHYDAMAVAAFEGAPEELDMTIFNPASADGTAIDEAANKLTEASHRARAFTDTANFTLRCNICQVGLKGEKEAVEHAKATTHQNFVEYR